MKLFTASQIKRWDSFTIKCEPISSLHLMDRAALSFTDWFCSDPTHFNHPITIICGNGNNGGDGLAIAMLLRYKFFTVNVLVKRIAQEDSPDFAQNLKSLVRLGDVNIQFIEDEMLTIQPNSIIIDALLGVGLNRPLGKELGDIIEKINLSEHEKIISVDLPSGLPAEGIGQGYIIKADEVFTFQVPKLSFFNKENTLFIERFVVGDIGLHEEFLAIEPSPFTYVDKVFIQSLYKKRSDFQHKGDFGHALIVAGQKGSLGAAVLSCKAALKVGAGLVTAAVPDIGLDVLQISLPEAMVISSGDINFTKELVFGENKFTIGCGPGLGQEANTTTALRNLLTTQQKPLVLDADALNIISKDKTLWDIIPRSSILTPHPKEFSRLFGLSNNSQEMFDIQKEMAIRYQVIFVLKGAFTRVCTPNGDVYINSTGNSGMATGGSGDVLTGMITGLLAQQYLPHEAAVFGVYLHGLAGDLALIKQSKESLIASDIIDYIGAAYKSFD
ncbi:MAG TPA: NAD(P)H-hydrate dehydratase [Saprospiraceae bacterium]|nr:NAD(P)H-hydrate dehydratase [Saprospiraceae bacterium]